MLKEILGSSVTMSENKPSPEEMDVYKPSPEDKKYYSLGEYVQKVEELKNRDLISKGKYDELLLDAFRADIVYNMGSEGIELNDW